MVLRSPVESAVAFKRTGRSMPTLGGTMTAATMILHVVTHTIHHRGNVDAVMYQCGMPRRRDGIPEFLVSRASAT